MATRLRLRKGTFFATALATVLCAGAAHAEYRVTAFKHAPGFEALMDGDYAAANQEAAVRLQSTGFAVDANRCVSQLMVESLDQALKSCNRALRQVPDRSPLSLEASRANESVVLSNRGVVLAMQGNLVAAEEDPVHAVIGLRNHGITCTGESLTEILDRVAPRVLRQVPMT